MTSQRHMRLALTSSLAVIGLLTAGCANQTSAYRTQRLGDSPMVITTDAYQRHLIVAPGRDGRGVWQTCAEAAPDVFSAISGSGAGDLGFNSTGERGVEAQARAAMSIAQSAATAERTQTINLLRESMFRTCERYMNGAIDRATLVVQAGRDWRAMIAILAIEQLTQTGRPASTVISAGGTSATVIGGEDAQRQLEAAKRELEEAREAQTEANSMQCPAAGAAAGGGAGGAGAGAGAGGAGAAGGAGGADAGAGGAGAGGADADADADAGAGGAGADGADAGAGGAETAPAAPAASDAAAGGEICDTKKTAIENANTRVQQAEAAVAAAQAKVNQAARSGGSTTPGTVNAGGGGGALTAEALVAVAPVVRHIVDRAFGTDETQLFCLQILQDRNLPANIRTSCLRYLMASVNRDTASLFQRANVQEGALLTSLEIADARTGLIELFTPLTPQQYESVRADLGRRLPGGFCASLSKQACIARIEAGEVDDPESRRVVLTFIAERAQSGR